MYDFNQSRPSEGVRREEIAKKLFGYVGENVFIQQPITVARGKTVRIGSGTYINSNLMLVDDYNITIGENCLIAPNVSICTTGHPVDPTLRTTGMYSFPVTIGNNVWTCFFMGHSLLIGAAFGQGLVDIHACHDPLLSI